MPNQVRGKALAQLFFSPVLGHPDKWICSCGTERVKNKAGFTNLLSHVHASHATEVQKLKEVEPSEVKKLANSFFLISEKALCIHAWLQIIVSGLYPFSIVENEVLCRHVQRASISVDTAMKYLHLVMQTVEKKIEEKLPAKFAIVFDGWSMGTTHYLGIFSSYASDTEFGFTTDLLGFTPLEDETSLGADEHIATLSFVLSVYNRTMENVVCFIGDNCSTNKSISEKLKIPLVGCASHRFNLAVEDILAGHKDVLETVRGMMIKLRSLIPAAKLRRHTHLSAVLDNKTRWSSKFQMLQRYQAIKEFIPLLGIGELDMMLPSMRENLEIERLCAVLGDLDSVTKSLQNNTMTMADTRGILDEVIAQFPSTKERLYSRAKITNNPEFESALVKIQDKNESELTNLEKKSVENFRLADSEVAVETRNQLTLAERAIKKRRINSNFKSAYVDTRFVLPTSNLCERLFSQSKYAIGLYRQNILPTNLESQIYLYVNSKYWNSSDVNEIVARRTND